MTYADLIEEAFRKRAEATGTSAFWGAARVLDETRSVEMLSMWVPVTLQTLVDSGNATPEQIAEYEAQEAQRKAEWKRIPLRRRMSIRWHVWASMKRRAIHDRLFPDFAEREDY